MAAKRKTTKAKKTTGKSTKTKTGKKKKTTAQVEVHSIRISCDGGCSADPDDLHVHFGDIVIFFADGTDAVVKFDAKSPFGRKTFIIKDGDFDGDKIDKKSGTFDYTPECESCPVPALPPRIIID